MLFTKDRFNKSKLQERPNEAWARRSNIGSSAFFQFGIMAAILVISLVLAACM